MTKINAAITGVQGYVPDYILTNKELETFESGIQRFCEQQMLQKGIVQKKSKPLTDLYEIGGDYRIPPSYRIGRLGASETAPRHRLDRRSVTARRIREMGGKKGVDDAAVHGQRFADRVIARPAGEIDRGPAHIELVPHALRGNARCARILVIARRAVHVRRESARRQAGDIDVILDQPRGHAPRQMDQRGLRRLVAVGFQRIDALPIDTSDVARPLKSKNPGISHSCGHDVHASIGAGVAAVFHEMRHELPGRVRVVFQPAEEVVPSGGEAIVEAGILDGMKAAVGIHVDPVLDVGSIGVREGCLTASSDKFILEIQGKSGHAARPHLAHDALLAGARVVDAFTGLVREHINPLESAVVTVGLFQAGEADNVVAGHAHLAGSARSFSPEIRLRVQEEMQRTASLIAEVHNCTATLEIMRGAPSIVNHSALDAIVRSAAGDLLGAGNVHELPHPSSGSEDFGLFGSRGPIYMLRLGVRTPGNPIAHLHTPEFFADERAVGLGIKLMGRVVLRALTSRLT